MSISEGKGGLIHLKRGGRWVSFFCFANSSSTSDPASAFWFHSFQFGEGGGVCCLCSTRPPRTVVVDVALHQSPIIPITLSQSSKATRDPKAITQIAHSPSIFPSSQYLPMRGQDLFHMHDMISISSTAHLARQCNSTHHS